ncbi:MAG: hypothetical protein A3F87_02305 [Omnitrophica WOR_2 bacterium RIFCSPLOWO2_12_FULL_51_24]|nr:MAG: hypothetical protein A2879_01645 [Omnitrophica WOR_2 bacterium RIFCSPHIGHO2_01_FULL_49_10]OGX35780.1 MAG: hypothetical protein A3I43_00610 [Omnitrophica WOR_2 bacterium RIFCSPLOWO2_02_FULL_50_19]OGX42060.1 MAG: hypothetical protein A3F87_02305 [Omnitrophica WOR_2 bacterium RIFCSPLOWO2_12_FULL_51_24]
MSERLFKINISTPEKTLYEGEISSLIAPGELGYLGVLVDHAPLIANLVPGKIIIKRITDTPVVFDSNGRGILEVFENKVNLLTDSIESSI